MAAPKYRLGSAQRNYAYEQEARKLEGLTEETPEEWKDRVREEWSPKALKCKWVCIVFHDHDVMDDGTPKPLHAHLVAMRIDPITLGESGGSGWRGLTKVSCDENADHVRNKTQALLYLFHGTEKARRAKKYIYDVSSVEVFTNENVSFDYRRALTGDFKSEEDEEETKASVRSQIVTDLIEGTMTLDDAMRIYKTDRHGVGLDMADWQSHKAGYKTSVDQYMQRMAAFYALPQNNRALTNIYIQAPGEKRKTDIALAIAALVADRRGVHQVAVEGNRTTFDFAGGYQGETVTIANELSGKVFNPDQFCSLLDTKHAGVANSRFIDKPWFAEWCIMTSSLSPERFVYDCYLPWAKERVHGQPAGLDHLPDEGDAEHAERVNALWQKHYESDPEIADKIRQMRRRFAIWLRGVGDEMQVIVRNPHSNPAHSFVAPDDVERLDVMVERRDEKSSPWLLFETLPNRGAEDIDAIVACVFSATKTYYDVAGYDVNPWTTVRPERLPIV